MGANATEMSQRQSEMSLAGKQRIIDVDLIELFGKITDKVIAHNSGDWALDRQVLFKSAASQAPEDKHLLFGICSTGTHLFTERDTFIKGIAGYMYWTAYEPDIPVMLGYMAEITGYDGKVIRGNVYDLGNFMEHADFVRYSAIPVAGVTVTFDNGAIYTASMDEYDLNRKSLVDENGKIIDKRFYSSNDIKLNTLLLLEEAWRGSFPVCNPAAYLQSLTDRLAEINSPVKDRIVTVRSAKNQVKGSPGKSAPKDKKSIGSKLRAAQEKVTAQTANKTSSRQRDSQTIH